MDRALSKLCRTISDFRHTSLSIVCSELSVLRLAIALLIGVATWIALSSLRQRPRVPGPRRLPVLGNIFQVHAELYFIQLTEWARKYGPIYSLDFVGNHVVVVNDYKTAGDLLDRRSSACNGRPRFVMAHEILCDHSFMPLEGNTEAWRRWRRTTGETFGPEGVTKYRLVQAEATALAMRRIAINPDTWERTLEVMMASAIFSTVYGWPALDPEENALDIKHIYDLARRIADAGLPGAFLVDLFPAMRHLPAWMAKWKREGLRWHDEMTKIFEGFSADARQKFQTVDQTQENYASKLLRDQHRHKFSEKKMAWQSAMMLAAGSETVATATTNFVLAMVNYPDVMHRAQAELDSVVGRKRLPVFEDARELPYICAVVRETLRWRPVAPLGLPHVATEDIWYEGYCIPKGTFIVGNIWAMNRDPAINPDFDAFRPERFLDESGLDANIPSDTHQMGHTTFGFGKRICVGMHFADQALFIAIATMLWAFDIKPPLDENGNVVIPPTNNWIDLRTVVRPAPFTCRFRPRFPEVLAILEASTGNL